MWYDEAFEVYLYVPLPYSVMTKKPPIGRHVICIDSFVLILSFLC